MIAISAVCVGVQLFSLALISLLFKSQGFSVPHQIIVGCYLPVFIPKSSKSLTLSSFVVSCSLSSYPALSLTPIRCFWVCWLVTALTFLSRSSNQLIQFIKLLWIIHSQRLSSAFFRVPSFVFCRRKKVTQGLHNRSKYKTNCFRGNISLIAHPCSFDTFWNALSISSISLTWLTASKQSNLWSSFWNGNQNNCSLMICVWYEG